MNYLILDVENTGLFDYTKPADAPGQPRVCEIGMIFANEDLEIEREVAHLIKPSGWTLDPECEAAKVHGLTQEVLEKDGVSMRDVAREYGEAIDARRIVVAYNALFDVKQMRAELRHAGYPDRFMQTRYICAMQGCRKIVDARTADGKKKAPKLEEACAHFKISYENNTHRALADAHRAYQILRKLREIGQMPAYVDQYEKRKK
jgi:DNA polymerase III epsilon subunit-like protein